MQGDLIVTLHDGNVDHMGDGLCVVSIYKGNTLKPLH